MANFAVTQVLGVGDMAYPHGIRDLFVWTAPTGPVLYAATLNGGGVGAFALSSSGGLSVLGARPYDALLAAGERPHMTLVQAGADPMLLVSGLSGRALGIDAAGAPVGWVEPGGWDGAFGHAERVALWGGAQILTTGPTSAVSLLSTDGAFTLLAEVPALDAGGFVQTSGGRIFALLPGEDALAHLAPGDVGTLAAGQVVGALDGLGWDVPSALVSVDTDDTPYIVVASAGSSSLTVLSFDGSTFRVHDHVIDDRTTRFDGVVDLAALSVNGRTFLAAGGGDDGVTVFEMLANGRLVHIQTIVDTTGLTLSNVAAVGLARAGDTLHLVAAGEGDPGLTVFSRAAGVLAAPLTGGVAGDDLSGSPADDLLSGGAGDDVLRGGGGDDILYDGEGSDVMSGGAGADIFVLAGDGASDRIEDFDPAEDRLDLSLYGGLYAVSGLTIQPTQNGAVITFRDERLDIVTASGAPLDAGHLTQENTIGLTRAPLAPIGRDVSGGAGPDTLFGASGSDRLAGLGGDDTLAGLDGDDALIGGSGRDALDGGAGRDSLSGGAGDDRLSGAAGADLLMGGAERDSLSGGAGVDLLAGGNGDDDLAGGPGNDVLRGGAGSDSLAGDDGADRLSGGSDADYLDGGSGDDLLDGGSGDDRLFGGAGRDVFVFRDGSGADRIEDFNGADGDRVDLTGLSSVASWDALVGRLSDGAGGAVIDAGSGDVLTLAGLSSDALSQDVFWF